MKEREIILENFLSSVIRTLNQEEIYDISQKVLVDLLQPDGLLMMFNKQAGRMYHVVRSWGNISYSKDYCVPSDSLLNHLMTADNLVRMDETSTDILNAMTYRKQQWLLEQNISAFYTIKYNRAIIGFIFIAQKNRAPLSVTEEKYLQKVCLHTCYALRNANLYQNAYRAAVSDDLTSLYNRKHAFDCIDRIGLERIQTSVLLFDIDDFKLYNELYGAKEGDNLICRCAKLILQELGPNDLAFRYGADEFMVLKPGANAESAREFGQRVITKIVSSNFSDTVWDMTVTCGISVFPDISKDTASLLHNTEQAVYYGKLEGKGKLIVYSRGMENRSQNPDIRAAYDRVAPTIYALTAAIDAKDSYTFVHSMNVSRYAVILAEALGMNSTDIEIIRDAGLLHDIGKISIPEHILQKTSRLTPTEYAIMKTHVENSTKMIRYLPDMDYVIPAVVGHHERYDGSGYPRGLKGENIPLMARILTIADSFDAMTARRPYKQPLSVSYAITELENNSGTQFDPELVPRFVTLIHNGKIAV